MYTIDTVDNQAVLCHTCDPQHKETAGSPTFGSSNGADNNTTPLLVDAGTEWMWSFLFWSTFETCVDFNPPGLIEIRVRTVTPFVVPAPSSTNWNSWCPAKHCKRNCGVNIILIKDTIVPCCTVLLMVRPNCSSSSWLPMVGSGSNAPAHPARALSVDSKVMIYNFVSDILKNVFLE